MKDDKKVPQLRFPEFTYAVSKRPKILENEFLEYFHHF